MICQRILAGKGSRLVFSEVNREDIHSQIMRRQEE